MKQEDQIDKEGEGVVARGRSKGRNTQKAMEDRRKFRGGS